ncbi:MAG: sigma-70 family RNA polymerase sigma factor, partial [Bacteroidota bacterium]
LTLVHSNYKDEHVSLQRQLEAEDSVHWMSKIMETLPERQKIIVQLRDVEHYEFDEISDMLGMNHTAIRVALSRARKTIKEALIKQHNYGIN